MRPPACSPTFPFEQWLKIAPLISTSAPSTGTTQNRQREVLLSATTDLATQIKDLTDYFRGELIRFAGANRSIIKDQNQTLTTSMNEFTARVSEITSISQTRESQVVSNRPPSSGTQSNVPSRASTPSVSGVRKGGLVFLSTPSQ